MPGKYKFVVHTADIAVEVTAENLEDSFNCDVNARGNAILEKPNAISNRVDSNEYNYQNLDESTNISR